MRAKCIVIVLFAATAAMLAGCTPMTAGQLVQAGYDAAKTSLAGSPAGQPETQHARSVMNAINVGQETAPIIASMGEPPKEKSGNSQGYTCYQYAAVYSPTEDAVIVSKDGKVVFYGNSTCRTEMQSANFKSGGKYAGGTGADSDAGGAPGAGADSGGSAGSGADNGAVANPNAGAGTGSTASPDTGAGSKAASSPAEAGSNPGSSPASDPTPASQ